MSIRLSFLNFFRHWSDRIFETVRFVLRQDETQSFFLVTCGFFMLIFTCLYENIITSQLIVPDEVRRYRTFEELTDDGFSIIVLSDSKLLVERKLTDSIDETISEHFLANGKSRDEFYQRVQFEFQAASFDAFLMDVGNASLRRAVLQVADSNVLSHIENVLSKLHGVSCHRVRNPVTGSLKFMYFGNFLVYEQLRLAQWMREHGFISWWYQLQEYSQKVSMSHLHGTREEVTRTVSSYISNMNLVPVYSVWFAFNLIGLLVFFVERNLNGHSTALFQRSGFC
jgi:hypothetical protein